MASSSVIYLRMRSTVPIVTFRPLRIRDTMLPSFIAFKPNVVSGIPLDRRNASISASRSVCMLMDRILAIAVGCVKKINRFLTIFP